MPRTSLERVDATSREEVMRMAREDKDPKVRTMTMNFLFQGPRPPAEGFFIDRLEHDDHEGPREQAAIVLERYGTVNALQVLDRVGREKGTPERVRIRAVRAAAVIRRRANEER